MTAVFTAGRRGYVWKNSKLYSFSKSEVIVLRSWPDPQGYVKTETHGWQSRRSDSDRLFSDSVRQHVAVSKKSYSCDISDNLRDTDYRAWRKNMDASVLASYAAMIPPQVLRQVRRYSVRRWHMLCLFARCPASLDLSKTNPALAFMLANSWVFHKPKPTKPMRTARRLLKKRYIDILRYIGFPATQLSLDVLSRIPSSSLSVIGLLRLRSALKRVYDNPFTSQLLAKSVRVNVGVINTLSNHWINWHVSSNLLSEIGADKKQDRLNPPVIRLLRRTIKFAKYSGRQEYPVVFSCLNELHDTHNRLSP
jgi:hypothetical protein